MNVILLGPPGAGKGTQAKRLSERYGFAHLSSGDLLRAEAQADTDLGREINSLLEQGHFVPDDMIISIVLSRFAQGGDGYLLDGFPRTLQQAERFDAALASNGRRIDAVLSVVVPDEQIVERILGRRSCTNCGAVYHVQFSPPQQADVCDACGGALSDRSDDTRDVLVQRLNAFHEQTEPLVNYYKARGVLHKIDGARDIDDVFADFCRVIDQVAGVHS